MYAVGLLTLQDAVAAAHVTALTLQDWLAHADDPDRQPGQATREILVTHLARTHLAAPGSSESTRPAPQGPADVVGDALARLTTEDRLALSLAEFDDLPWASAEALAAHGRRTARPTDVAAARATLADALSVLPFPPPLSEALRTFVEAHPPPFVPLDRALVHTARRRRVRWGLSVGAGVLAVAAAVAALGRGASAVPDPVASVTTSATAATARTSTIDGMTVVLGTPLADQPRLPMLPAATSDLALPESLGPIEGSLPTLDGGTAADRSVRAAFVVRDAAGRGTLVLFVPGSARPLLSVPRLTVSERAGSALTAESISDDRRRVAVIAGDAVVAVDVRDASTRTYPVEAGVPLPADARVGWSPGARRLVVRSSTLNWMIDVSSGQVQRATPPISATRYQLAAEASPMLLGFDAQGRMYHQRPVPGPIRALGATTVTNDAGWSAAAVTYSATPFQPDGATGLYAVSIDNSPLSVGLVDEHPPLLGPLAPDVLGWAPGDRVLRLSGSAARPLILAWDVRSGQEFRVTQLPPIVLVGEPGWQGEFALSP